jgi:dTDP-4-amino-4,6-dideoxygalactose transaminase
VRLPTGTTHLRPIELGLSAAPVVPRLVRRFDLDMVVQRRRRNYRRLVAALDGVVTPLVPSLPEGTCPLFLPVRARDKARLVKALLALGVEAIDFWAAGDPACDLHPFPEVASLRRELLELPCHQSLDDEAVDAVAVAVRRAVGPRGRGG